MVGQFNQDFAVGFVARCSKPQQMATANSGFKGKVKGYGLSKKQKCRKA